MTKSEAEEIKAQHLENYDEYYFGYAKGYLESYAKAEEILVEALEEFIEADKTIQTTVSVKPRMKAEAALARWRKEA